MFSSTTSRASRALLFSKDSQVSFLLSRTHRRFSLLFIRCLNFSLRQNLKDPLTIMVRLVKQDRLAFFAWLWVFQIKVGLPPKMSLICAKSEGHHYVIMGLESFTVIRHFWTLFNRQHRKPQKINNIALKPHRHWLELVWHKLIMVVHSKEDHHWHDHYHHHCWQGLHTAQTNNSRSLKGTRHLMLFAINHFE